MAYKVHDMCYLDAGDEVDRTCIWCGKECDNTQLLDTGEEIEMWCYCKECDSECFHQIKNKNNGN